MWLVDGIAVFLLGALVLYLLFGIADFGGGILHGLSFGRRGPAQRALIEKAIAPIWEANHVWLILALVLLFVGYPRAFRVLSEGLYLPLLGMLVGIVVRGSAFVFRQYSPTNHRLWGRIFSLASFTTPFFLGVCLGAITSGTLREDSAATYTGWFAPFPALVGALTVAVGFFLASVYLTNETRDDDLRDSFRRKAYAGAGAVAVLALLCGIYLPPEAAYFRGRFVQLWGVKILTAFFLGASLLCLRQRWFGWARAMGAGAMTLVIVGWAVTQYPYLIPPDITLAGSASPRQTLEPLFYALVAGSVFVLPSLYWMLRTFKGHLR